MRRKFKLKVSYTFNGCFTLRAASGKEAARLVSEQCGTVLSAIQTTLGEESRVFRSDPDYEMSGCCVVCSGNDDKETPSDKDLILICCSDSETEVYPCELRPISDNH